MSAKKLLDLIEQAGLLDSESLQSLRRQIREQKASAASVAKHLVDKGLLTRFQATRLVSEAGEPTSPKSDPEPPPAPPEEEELGLAPIDDADEEELIRTNAAALAASRRNAEDVVLLEDAGDALKPVEDAAGGLTPVEAPTGLSPLEPDDSSLHELLPDLDDDPLSSLEDPPMSLPRRPARPANIWESKLILGGGFTLLLLLVMFVVLFVNLSKTPAIEMWNAAMEFYRSESYSQAQLGFTEYLEDYPEEEHASEARVRIVLCKIRNAIRDPRESLRRSQELLPTIERSEPKFSVARDELATILLKIPQSFIEAAKNTSEQTEKQELVALAEAGLELVNNPSYVPSSKRSSIQTELTRVVEDVNLVHRDIDRDTDLTRAIDEIDTAAEAGRTAAAYDTYKTLLRTYPGLRNSPELIDAVRRVSTHEQGLVVLETEILTAETQFERRATPPLALASHRASTTGDGAESGGSLVLPINAAVYGLNQESGAVRWRQQVGETLSSSAQPVSDQEGADVLLVESRNHSLTRVDAATGEPVWRLDAGAPFFPPLATSTGLYVSTETGKLLKIDPATGGSNQQLALPQRLTTAASAAPNHPLILQVGEHSNVYLLTVPEFACESVYYLGHQAGAVEVPPLVHFGHVFIAENSAADHSLLHVLAIKSGDGAAALAAAQPPIRLQGNVVVPIQRYGRRILVATNRGGVEVFDVGMNKSPAAATAASLAPTRSKPLTAYPTADGGSLWVAGDRLTQYRVQVTTKEITREAITHIGDTFLGTPRVVGNHLIHVRRPKTIGGVVVSASSLDDIRQSDWETHVEVPVALLHVGNDQKISAALADSTLFEFPASRLAEGGIQQQTAGGHQAGSFTIPIPLPDGGAFLYDPANHKEILAFTSASDKSTLRNIRLDLDDEQITATPALLAGNLLVPTINGAVALLSGTNGKAIGRPFQPRLAPGEQIQWLRPIPISENEFVIADDRREIYRVTFVQEPIPHLKMVESKLLSMDLASPLVSLGETIFAVARSADADSLVAIDSVSLDVVTEHDLAGTRLTWGPSQAGERVLFATDHSELHCYSRDAEPAWDSPGASFGQLVGPPLIDGDSFVFASRGGMVWRLSRDTGESLGSMDVGERLTAGPVILGSQILVGGEDGTVHALTLTAGP